MYISVSVCWTEGVCVCACVEGLFKEKAVLRYWT